MPISTSQYCRSASSRLCSGLPVMRGRMKYRPVRYHPIVEVGDALHIRQGHHRALDVDEEVVDGAGEDELGADVGVHVAELALDRVPDVDQEDHDRDH
ncbi:MAG: hypothetical protein MUC46_04350, partial [Desulfobacterales bacterium]|nr:hypothetical protein [Desulfobacterales bacterium]